MRLYTLTNGCLVSLGRWCTKRFLCKWYNNVWPSDIHREVLPKIHLPLAVLEVVSTGLGISPSWQLPLVVSEGFFASYVNKWKCCSTDFQHSYSCSMHPMWTNGSVVVQTFNIAIAVVCSEQVSSYKLPSKNQTRWYIYEEDCIGLDSEETWNIKGLEG